MSGPRIPSGNDAAGQDEFAVDAFVHAIGHAEELAEEIEEPAYAAMAWAQIALAWATMA